MNTSSPRVQANAWIALLAFVALSAGALFAVLREQQRPAIPNLIWPDPPTLGAFSLSMADGATLNQDSLKGHWTLLFFGFTHCPDVCPNTLSVLKQTTQRLADDPLYRARGQVVFVSVDPERDQPAALAKYVHYFNPQFLAATGPAAALADLTRPLGVIHARVPLAGEEYSFDHTASIFLIDPALRLLGVWSLPHDAETISTAFRQISAFGAQNP